MERKTLSKGPRPRGPKGSLMVTGTQKKPKIPGPVWEKKTSTAKHRFFGEVVLMHFKSFQCHNFFEIQGSPASHHLI